MADHIVGLFTGGVSAAIAITSEVIAGEKGRASAAKRREASQIQTQQTDSLARRDSLSDGEDQQNMTELEWELAELEEELGEPPAYDFTNQVVDTAQGLDQLRRLPQPIVIPQRRPGSRQRGFMRAYAPSLGTHANLDQQTFFKFLSDFDRAASQHAIFNVINLACFVTGTIPNPITTAVSVAVGTVSGIAAEIQTRYTANAFLDKANEEIFKPRGLFVMVMTYKPECPDDMLLTADNSDPASAALVHQSTATHTQQVLRRLRESSGKTTDAQMPEFAPLVHPQLDMVLSSSAITRTNPDGTLTTTSDPNNTQALSLIKRKSTLVQEYLDRRTQTTFATKNPNSKYTAAMGPAATNPDSSIYVNRYANPDHPVNNGSIFALFSGGTFDPIGAGRVSRAERKARKMGEEPLSEQERHDALMGRKVRGRVTGTNSKKIPVVGKLFKMDALYLLVANLPSEEEVGEVKERLGVGSHEVVGMKFTGGSHGKVAAAGRRRSS